MASFLEITDHSTTFRIAKNPDGTIQLHCQGTISCIETFPDGQALAAFCQAHGIDLNTIFSKLTAWDKPLAAQFAKGIYR
ncbi:hypothetical protein ACTVJH_01080 [Desulfoplanes sp. PS50]